jgi:hypothetical protein
MERRMQEEFLQSKKYFYEGRVIAKNQNNLTNILV